MADQTAPSPGGREPTGSPVLDLCERVAELIAAELDAAGVAAAVSREYELTYDLGRVEGLKVHVFPETFRTDERATRDEDYLDATVAVVLLERYSGRAPRPPRDWLDERAALVDRCVYDPLRRVKHPLTLDRFWATRVECRAAFDPEHLDKHKVFWSEVEAEFRTLRTDPR